MPNVEFYYFPIKARGEQIRLLLAYGGEDWNDNRITSADWPKFKPKTPFGQMPVMAVDGKQYAQSIAIARYLGRKYGLAGANLEEDFQIDQNVDFLMDIFNKANVNLLGKLDQIIRERTLQSEANVKLLEKLDQIIRDGNGHLALGKLTWADFVFAGIYDQLKHALRCCNLGSKYPSFDQLVKTVYSLPRVKEFADAAPK